MYVHVQYSGIVRTMFISAVYMHVHVRTCIGKCSTESKTSKKGGGASAKQPTTKKPTNGKKDSKSRNSVSPTPAPPATVAGATTENTKKGTEKKRKKVLVEEVTDEDVGTKREQRKEAEPKQERVVNDPEPEINLHDIKAEEVWSSNIIVGVTTIHSMCCFID